MAEFCGRPPEFVEGGLTDKEIMQEAIPDMCRTA
jgi:hypothetical protein